MELTNQMQMSPYIIAKKWLAAFNEHDLESLLSLYDENAEHFSPKLKLRDPASGGKIKGKNAMRKWWNDAFERLPQLTYQEITITANDNRVFMEYTRMVPEEDNLNVAEVLEVSNGLIVASRVYHG
jgi:ketosteroid isomerase-like protein